MIEDYFNNTSVGIEMRGLQLGGSVRNPSLRILCVHFAFSLR